MSDSSRFVIEPYAHGFIVADYGGDFDARFTGVHGLWCRQPIRAGDSPFPTEQAAREFVETLGGPKE